MSAANADVRSAANGSLRHSDITPQIPVWPEVGDILSATIAEAAAGGNVRELMLAAAEQSDRVLRRVGRIARPQMSRRGVTHSAQTNHG